MPVPFMNKSSTKQFPNCAAQHHGILRSPLTPLIAKNILWILNKQIFPRHFPLLASHSFSACLRLWTGNVYILHIVITAVILLYLQSSDDMKSKLKIQQFAIGPYFPYVYTVNRWGEKIYNEHGRHIYDAVGADYQVLLSTEQICW